MDVAENTVREENKTDVVAQEEKIDNVSIMTDAKEENLWTCEKCTLKNSMAVLSCVVCGHSKSRDSSSSNRNDAPATIEPTPKRRSLTEASNASLARSCMESHWSIVFDEETNDALWECEEENMTCLKIARKFSLPILSSLIAKINLKRFPQLTEKSKLRVGTRLLIPWLPIALDRRFRRLGWGRLITTNNALKMKCDGPKKFFWVRRRRRRIHFKYKKHTHTNIKQVQCDIETCGKWRRLPISCKPHVDSTNNWTCAMNVSDKNRMSCDAEEENYQIEPLFAKQQYDQAGDLFDTAKKCIAHITGQSSKNVTNWMKSCLSLPSSEMAHLEAPIERSLRIWMDGMNRADSFLCTFYAKHVPELETSSEIVASEWDYVLDEMALERLNAALWKRHGQGFFSHVSQDVLRVAKLEKISVTSLPNGTDFEKVMMTREKNYNLVRRAHEALATVGWNNLKKTIDGMCARNLPRN